MADKREFAPSAMVVGIDYAFSFALGAITLSAALHEGNWLLAVLLFAYAGALIYKQLRLSRQPYAIIDGQGITLPRQSGARYEWDTVRAVYPARLSLEIQVAHGPLVPIPLWGIRSSEREDFARLVETRAAAAYRG